jgi:hypothetical protein
MPLAYKVEELLALRDSVSESAVSIDRFADEDVIKGQSHSSLPRSSLHFTCALSLKMGSPLGVASMHLVLNTLCRTRSPSFRICVGQSSQQIFRQKPSASSGTVTRSSCIAKEAFAYSVHQARQS